MKVLHRTLDLLEAWLVDCKLLDLTSNCSLLTKLENFLNAEVSVQLIIHQEVRAFKIVLNAYTFIVIQALVEGHLLKFVLPTHTHTLLVVNPQGGSCGQQRGDLIGHSPQPPKEEAEPRK